MNKNTMTVYGWIIIMVLVLSIMLAFATPFGKYIGQAFGGAAVGADKALDSEFDNYENKVQFYEGELYVPPVVYGGLYETGTNFQNSKKDFTTLLQEKTFLFVNGFANPDTKIRVKEGNENIIDGALALQNTIEIVNTEGFKNCKKLTEIHLNKVQFVLYDAFKGCSNLQSVYIGEKTLTIGERAFSGCTKLETIHFAGKVEEFKNVTIIDSTKGANKTIKVKCIDGETTARLYI